MGVCEVGKWRSQQDLNQVGLTLVPTLNLGPKELSWDYSQQPKNSQGSTVISFTRSPSQGSDWPGEIFSMDRMVGPVGRGEGKMSSCSFCRFLLSFSLCVQWHSLCKKSMNTVVLREGGFVGRGTWSKEGKRNRLVTIPLFSIFFLTQIDWNQR